MTRLTSTLAVTPTPPDRTMSAWAPATRVGSGPRSMVSGARLFAALAALVVLTRRRSA